MDGSPAVVCADAGGPSVNCSIPRFPRLPAKFPPDVANLFQRECHRPLPTTRCRGVLPQKPPQPVNISAIPPLKRRLHPGSVLGPCTPAIKSQHGKSSPSSSFLRKRPNTTGASPKFTTVGYLPSVLAPLATTRVGKVPQKVHRRHRAPDSTDRPVHVVKEARKPPDHAWTG